MKTKIKNEITLSQLYILIQKESGLSTEQIAEKIGIKPRNFKYQIKKGFQTFQSFYRLFNALEIPLCVEFGSFEIENFELTTFSKLAYISTGLSKTAAAEKIGVKYYTFRDGIFRNNLKTEVLKKYFKALGSEFNIIFNNTKYIIK
jgi:hypothetical protein